MRNKNLYYLVNGVELFGEEVVMKKRYCGGGGDDSEPPLLAADEELQRRLSEWRDKKTKEMMKDDEAEADHHEAPGISEGTGESSVGSDLFGEPHAGALHTLVGVCSLQR